ncbi:MAG: hypothetical protein ACRDDH_11810 [Cetobacterium sp.]|uniref:hypothetical protein n=1 Tax=Cetobacterium sp. TaxID=2071632 RepID=UPI003EE68552
MEFLIAVITSHTTQRVENFYLGENVCIDYVKSGVLLDLKEGEEVNFYYGANDRRVEDDGFVKINMKECGDE